MVFTDILKYLVENGYDITATILMIIWLVCLFYFCVYRPFKKDSQKTQQILNDLPTNICTQNEKLVNNIIEHNNKTNDKLIDMFEKQLVNNTQKIVEEHSKAEISTHIKLNNQAQENTARVCDLIESIMDKFDPSRVFILQIHNSLTDLGNNSMLKYDIVHAQNCKGAIPLNSKDHHYSEIEYFISQLNNSNNNYIHLSKEDIVHLDESSKTRTIYAYILNLHFEDVVYGALTDRSNNIIGLLVVGYSQNHPYNFDEKFFERQLTRISENYHSIHPFHKNDETTN